MKLFYREFGKGDKVVFILHGLFGLSDNFVSFAKQLSENHKTRIIIPDLRNHGQSMHHNVFDYFSMTDDLYELFESLDVKSADLIGHSMGGKLAMHFALEYPEKIDKLIVSDISPVQYHSYKHAYLIDLMADADLSEFNTRKQFADRLRQKVTDEKILLMILKNIQYTKRNNLTWKLNIDGIRQNIDKVLRFEIENKIFSKETLFLKGELSDYINDNHHEDIIKMFPKSEIKIVPQASHWIHADNYEFFVQAVKEFIF